MMGIVVILIGIVILILSLLKTNKNNEFIKKGTHVVGVLVNYKEQVVDQIEHNRATGVSLGVGNNGLTNQHFYQTIYASVYEYVVNGFKYYICDESYSSTRKPLGSNADIYYMSNNPNNAVVASKGSNAVAIIASIVFIVIGVLLLMNQ